MFSLNNIVDTVQIKKNFPISPSLLPPDYDGSHILMKLDLQLALLSRSTVDDVCISFEDQTGGIGSNYPRCGYFLLVDNTCCVVVMLSMSTMQKVGWTAGEHLTWTTHNGLTLPQLKFLTQDECRKVAWTINFSKV